MNNFNRSVKFSFCAFTFEICSFFYFDNDLENFLREA